MMALLADHLWQSTLFAAAAGLLAAALHRRRAQARYGLWLAASVKFLVPFSALVATGRQLGWLSPLHAAPTIRAAAQPVVSAIVHTVAAAPIAPVPVWPAGDMAAMSVPVVLIAIAAI